MSSHTPVQRLLLVAPNWLGDALLATTLIRAVKAQRPQLHLAALAVPRAAEVLRGNPHVDELIVYDERGSDRGWFAKHRLARRLRRGAFDAALLVRPSFSRAALLWWAGIPRRVGHAHRTKDWFLTELMPAPLSAEHRADGYLRLLAALDPPLAGARLGWPAPQEALCEFFVQDRDRALVRQWLHAQGVMNDQRLIVLHPAGNWAHKRWPAERFAALGDRLHEAHGAHIAHIAITGSDEDRAVAQRVQGAMRSEAILAAGELTFQQLGALIERADLIVVNDSGPLHLAAALQRPVLALFGPTSPAVTGPYHAARARVLHHSNCCPEIPCYRPDDPPHPGMLSLTVDEVAQAADEMLSQPQATGNTQQAVRHG